MEEQEQKPEKREEPTHLLFCFCCGMPIESAMLVGDNKFDHTESSPPCGIVFTSIGNYGTTLYDEPFSGHHLQLVVCDLCTLDRKERIREFRPVDYDNPHPMVSEPWNPDRPFVTEMLKEHKEHQLEAIRTLKKKWENEQ
jgi:hypothetical protein